MISEATKKVYLVIVCMVLTGWWILGFASTQASAKEVLIGISGDITGMMAAQGRPAVDGYILAIEEWNKKGGVKGQRIEYNFRNHNADPVRATGNAKIFRDSGVCAVLGGIFTTAAVAEMKILAPAQIPLIGHAAAMAVYHERSPDGKVYYFSNCGSDVAFGRAYLDILAGRGYKKLAILTLNLAWPRDLAGVVKEWINREYGPKNGMSIVGTVEADVNATDLSVQVNQLKQLNPDAVIACVYTATSLSLGRAFAEAKWNPPWATLWCLTEPAWKSGERKLFYNALGSSYYDGVREDYLKKAKEFDARFGYEPLSPGVWVTGYDAANLLFSGIGEVGPNPTAIRDWLATKAYGRPMLSGAQGHVCKFRDVEETWLGRKGVYYSAFDGTDYGKAWVDKEGKLDWMKLK
jgi:ABC-type branched-subunit amino acid transport system substrate-binding protein